MAAATRTETEGRTYVHAWSLTTADPTGDSVSMPGAADRSVHIYGTIGAPAATVVIEGSNEPVPSPTSWVVLDDTFDTALSFNTAGHLRAVNANILHIRARLSVVGTGAAVEVRLISRSTMK
jgi:hypothetical protein